MSTITFEVDDKNLSFVKTLLEHLKGVKNVTVQEEESFYKTDFVNSVKEGREEYNKGECTTISVEDLWK
ncbi:DUF2683 family protein [Flavobacterium flavipallidum]|uniref:DUF2683 family protein n=1 Tax=Flavobacterium flavipallidum TaxID=3139140 RepID=A0ABU9HJA3_9FLAO